MTKLTDEQTEQIREYFADKEPDERIGTAAHLLGDAAAHAAQFLGRDIVAKGAWLLFFDLYYKLIGPQEMERWFRHMAEVIHEHGDSDPKSHIN